jgi:hypothetical protein
MGASNFHNVNARNIYAVLMSYERPVINDYGDETGETEWYTPEGWEWSEFKSEIREQMQTKAIEKGYSYYANGSIEDPHECRSYPSIVLFTIESTKTYGDIDITVSISAVVRIGYHDGACLDWWIHNDEPEVTLEESFEFASNLPAGMIKILSKHANNWYEKTKEELINLVEEHFKEHSESYQVAAKFSNGETIYAKV